MSANDRQIGGAHYKNIDGTEQHWDFTWRHMYDQFEYCASKYVERYPRKNGVEDIKKAIHHLEKYTELGGPRSIHKVNGRTEPSARNPDAMAERSVALGFTIVQGIVLEHIFKRRPHDALDILKKLLGEMTSQEVDEENFEATAQYTNQ